MHLDPLKDQFLLIDDSLVNAMVDAAHLSDADIVAEIGAGTGVLTRALALKAKEVITFEIDRQFESSLNNLPHNVKVRFDDAHRYFSGGGKFYKHKEWNKIVANIPYSIGEWLLHNLAFVLFDCVVLCVPHKFLVSVQASDIFSSFFRFETMRGVPKESFNPKPKTNSVIVRITRLPDAIETRNLPLFLRQYVYQHEGQKICNAFVEGLITYARLTSHRVLTKNSMRALLTGLDIPSEILQATSHQKKAYTYAQSIAQAFDKQM